MNRLTRENLTSILGLTTTSITPNMKSLALAVQTGRVMKILF